MKHLQTTAAAALLFVFMACSDQSSNSESKADSMPVVTPEVTDTSRVMTTPPTGDSNVVKPDSTVDSR